MMADVIEFKIGGLESLLEKFDAISYDTRRKGGRAALRKAAQLVADAARQNATGLNDPETSTEIAKNIALRWNNRLFKQSGDLGFRVGVLGGAKQKNNYHTRRGRAGGTFETGGDQSNPGGNTFYWRFLEFGTAKMAAKPFMRKALADNIEAATAMFVSEFDKALDRAIKRASKKAGP